MVVKVKNNSIESSKMNLLIVAYEFSVCGPKPSYVSSTPDKPYDKGDIPHKTINVTNQVAGLLNFSCFEV